MLRFARAFDWFSRAATIERVLDLGGRRPKGRPGGGGQGEEIGFQCGDAVEAPGGVGEGLGRDFFRGAFGEDIRRSKDCIWDS